MSHNTREVIIVAGRTGHGKSQWAKRDMLSRGRALIIDPQGEYDCEGGDIEAVITQIADKKIFRAKIEDVRLTNEVCILAMTIPRTTLYIEEAQRIIPARVTLPPACEDIIYRGRHTETSLIAICQRISTLHIAVRSQYSRVIAFRQTEARDLSALTDIVGEELSDMISVLPPLEYLDIDSRGNYKRTKITSFL